MYDSISIVIILCAIFGGIVWHIKELRYLKRVKNAENFITEIVNDLGNCSSCSEPRTKTERKLCGVCNKEVCPECLGGTDILTQGVQSSFGPLVRRERICNKCWGLRWESVK